MFLITLEIDIAPEIINILAESETVFVAGRNNGVAEELALKVNEITYKKSAFLEGATALHAIAEVLEKKDIVIIIDPLVEEENDLYEELVITSAIEVIAISTRHTRFKTILIPDSGEYQNYIEMAAGWNLFVEAGIYLGNNIDITRKYFKKN